jgi:hypothetical protein
VSFLFWSNGNLVFIKNHYVDYAKITFCSLKVRKSSDTALAQRKMSDVPENRDPTLGARQCLGLPRGKRCTNVVLSPFCKISNECKRQWFKLEPDVMKMINDTSNDEVTLDHWNAIHTSIHEIKSNIKSNNGLKCLEYLKLKNKSINKPKVSPKMNTLALVNTTSSKNDTSKNDTVNKTLDEVLDEYAAEASKMQE